MGQNEKVIAITGASGAIYGLRLIQEFLKRGDDVSVIISPSGFLVMEQETGLKLKGNKFRISDVLKKYFGRTRGRMSYYPANDIASCLSSGNTIGRIIAHPAS